MIKSSKAISADKTEVSSVYKLDGMHQYYQRVIMCASIRESDDILFVALNGSSKGVICRFPKQTMFKPCEASMVIND